MKTVEEMNQWNYKVAWKYFTENAFMRYIPETEIYVRSLEFTPTIDLRNEKFLDAKELILDNISSRTLILIDGASNNGKST